MANILQPQVAAFQVFGGLWSNRSPLTNPTSGAPLMLDGSNIEHTDQGTLARRPGFTQYAATGASDVARDFFSFRKANVLKVVADLQARVAEITGGTVTTLYTPANSNNRFSFVSVGDTLYFTKAQADEQKKWVGSTVHKWGIAAPTSAPTFTIDSGMKSPGTTAGTNWTNPNNAQASDNAWAEYSTTTQDDLRCTNFGFSLPASITIQGIEVLIEGHATDANAANRQIRVGLTKNGSTLVGTRKTDVQLPQDTDSTVILGSSVELWDTTWADTDIESSNFGVLISDDDTTGAGTLRIDHVRVRVSHSGALRPTRGYKYRYCYKNSTTGHISTASPASVCTNTFNGVVTVEGARSTDPQVDMVEIYRTADGGGIFFKAGEVANPGAGNWTFVDGTADIALGTLPVPLAGLNDPPPAQLENISYHLGRVWGSVNNILYYSGGGEIVNGVPEEAWSPLNFFIFPEPITATAAYPLGLVVATVSNLYLVRGTDPLSFFAMPWLSEIGVLNRQAMWVAEDTIYLFTAKREMFAISLEQRSDIGFPIADKLELIDPALATVTMFSCGCESPAVFVCDGAGGFFKYSLLTQQWSTKGSVASGLTLLKSVEAVAGDYGLLGSHGTSASPILQRDHAVYTDNGTTYALSATLGSFMLAPAGATSVLDALTFMQESGSVVSPSIRLNSLTDSFHGLVGDVNEPPELDATSLVSKRFYTHKIAQSQVVRHAQIKLTWNAADEAVELLELGLLFRARAV